MSKKVFSQLFHSPLAEISNLALSAVLTFIVIFVDWIKCGFSLNIPIDLSHMCLTVSHWVVPHWSVATHFTYEAVIHRVSLHYHKRWVCLSPSISISCRPHPWILVCSVHIQLLWWARLTAKKMPPFPLLLLWVVVTQRSVIPKVHPTCRIFWRFMFFCHILLFVCLVYWWSDGL